MRSVVTDLRQLVFIDETGSDNRTVVPTYGYSLVGRRAVTHSTFLRSTRLNLLAAIDIDGIIDFTIHSRSLSARHFEDFFLNHVLPHCAAYPAPRSIIVLDNASIHSKQSLIPICEALGILILFLPPYSPDFNPIELSFRFLKSFLATHRLAFSLDPLDTLLYAMDALQFDHSSLFAEAGYSPEFFKVFG